MTHHSLLRPVSFIQSVERTEIRIYAWRKCHLHISDCVLEVTPGYVYKSGPWPEWWLLIIRNFSFSSAASDKVEIQLLLLAGSHAVSFLAKTSAVTWYNLVLGDVFSKDIS